MKARIAVATIALVIAVTASYYLTTQNNPLPQWGPRQSSPVSLIDQCRYIDEPPVTCVPTSTNLYVLNNGLSFSTQKSCGFQVGQMVEYRVSTAYNSQGDKDVQVLNGSSNCQPI